MTALTFGNVHGVYKPGAVKLRPEVLKEIQDGTFARNWLLENRAAGRANFLAQRRLHKEHQIEQVGAQLRNMMPWLRDKKELNF